MDHVRRHAAVDALPEQLDLDDPEAGRLSEAQTALTNGVLHWGGTIATIFTALLLGRLGLRWVVMLLALGIAGCFTIATTGFASDAR